MTLLESWVATPAAKALGWTLFYSLFEGAIVALLLALVLWTVRPARLRYIAACLAMIAILAGFGITFGRMYSQQSVRSLLAGTIPIPPPPDDAAGSARATRATLPLTAANILPWLAPFWIAGVLVFHLRNLAAWLAARRLCRTAVCRVSEIWMGRLDYLRARLRISRPVSLLESGLAGVPVVVGYLRPVILMPAGLLTGLPAGQIETILLHELAHIRRCDYLVNLLQAIVEGLLFYHPAIWWISGVIRAERENCCDDLVVATHGDAGEYAAALAAVEANRSELPALATAATGGSLVKRIRRLLVPAERPRHGATPVLATVILTLTAVLTLTAWQTNLTQAQPQAEPPRTSPYAKWLNEDVAYIVTDVERRAFNDLQSDEERTHFIAQFWQRRNPTPGSTENPFQEEHYRRIAYANDHFDTDLTPGWKTDRGRIYITYGPADEIESHPKGGGVARPEPFEQWRYRHIEGVGNNIVIDFVDATGSGEYRMTTDPATPQLALTGVSVVAPGDGTASLSIPLAAFANHSLSVSGRLASAQREVQVFEIPVATAGPAFTRVTRVQPGSYRWFIAVRDLTTGTLYTDTLAFEVK